MSTTGQPTDASNLGILGFGEQEERLYAVLLAAHHPTLSELAKATGLDRNKVLSLLGALETKGCVSRVPGRPTRYVGAPPDLAIGALILRVDERLDRARMHSLKLLQRMRDTSENGTPPTEILEVIEGREAIYQRFLQIQQTARSEVLGFDRPPYMHSTENRGEDMALARGVRYRAVYLREGVQDPSRVPFLRSQLARGEDARVADVVPVKMMIADRKMALIPHRLEHPSAPALVIHASALLESFIALFELVWEKATPLRLLDDTVVEDPSDRPHQDADVLNLISIGLKDDAIARNLGLSPRTVRRRITEMMTTLGAGNRFQAGVEAARRGWI